MSRPFYQQRFLIAMLVAIGLSGLFIAYKGSSRGANASGDPQITSPVSHGRDHLNDGSPEPSNRPANGGNRSPKSIPNLKSEFAAIMDSNRSTQEKINSYGIVVGKMSQVMDCKEVLAFLNESLGEGATKTALLGEVFSNSKNNLDELVAQIRTLKGMETQAAEIGLYDHIMRGEQPAADLAKVINAGLPGLSDGGVSTAIGVDLTNQGNDQLAKQRYAELLAAVALLPEDKKHLLTSVIAKGAMHKLPFEVWHTLSLSKDAPDSANNQALASLRGDVARNMMSEDPGKAMALIAASGDPDAKLVESNISYWLNLNPKEAKRWLDENQSTLTPLQLDATKTAMAKRSVDSKDLAAAKLLIPEIKDPVLRKKAEGEVWQAERDILRKEMGTNPAETLQSLVSGKSRYADYWIEEAVGTWVAKDFDKAQDWYQKNWKSLPASKSQYVAAAFANQALKQGDTTTATQWVNLIQDPKTKQRIQEAISKSAE
jgi:hypothetical protein